MIIGFAVLGLVIGWFVFGNFAQACMIAVIGGFLGLFV